MEELFLYKFYVDCGRQGEIEGLFIETQKQVDFIIGKYVHFGEILGKHSEIYGVIDSKEIIKLDVPSDAVNELAKALGSGTISGCNPLDYWDEEQQQYHDEQQLEENK